MIKKVFEPLAGAKRLIGSWLILCVCFACCEIWFRISTPLFLVLVAVCFIVISLLRAVTTPLIDDAALCFGASLYGLVLVYRYDGKAPYAFLLVVLSAVVFFTLPALKKQTLSPADDFSVRYTRLLVVIIAVFFAGGISLFTVLRYLTFSSPNYDFGLFCNMFYYMKETGLPLTTSERNQLMSHFAVHISPIYYVLLPIYAVFSSPVTLQICQALVLASGLIPLYLLARHYALSNIQTVLLALLYALHPVVSAGCSYDIHENCFLLPLLLWLFFCYETGHLRWLAVVSVLVLLVKEDAAAFLVIFGLYLLAARGEKAIGGLFISGALLYFGIAVILLNTFGAGAMFGRYGALFSEANTVDGFLQTLIRAPGMFLERLVSFTNSATQKPIYLLQILLPFIPIIWQTKRYSRFLLLTPLLLNLLADSVYQCDIGFQYTFASLAFCLYFYMQNLADKPTEKRRNPLLFGAFAACLLYAMIIMPKIETYVNSWIRDGDAFTQMDTVLDTIPQEASVTASTMLVPHLAQRDIIYEDFYHPEPDTDFVVLDMRGGGNDFRKNYRDTCLKKGYTEWASTDQLLILQKPAE